MSGNIVAGFVKGFSGQALDSLEKRREEEAEIKKLRILEQLRMDTEKEMAVFKEGLPSSQLARKATEVDIDRTRRITELEERKFEVGRDDEMFDRQMAERDASRQERYTNASIASLDRSNRDSDKPTTDLDIANELIYRYKTEVDEAAKSGNISRSAIRAAAAAVVENSRTGQQAQKEFLKFLDRYRTGRAHTDQRKRSLEEF